MKKYFIIPVDEIVVEIYAENPESALEKFAFGMDYSDMGAYFKTVNFKAVTQEEYNNIKEIKDWEAHVRTVKNFMKNVIMDDFNVPEESASDMAEIAYEHYADADYPLTEYECAEWAANEYWEKYDSDNEEEK